MTACSAMKSRQKLHYSSRGQQCFLGFKSPEAFRDSQPGSPAKADSTPVVAYHPILPPNIYPFQPEQKKKNLQHKCKKQGKMWCRVHDRNLSEQSKWCSELLQESSGALFAFEAWRFLLSAMHLTPVRWSEIIFLCFVEVQLRWGFFFSHCGTNGAQTQTVGVSVSFLLTLFMVLDKCH